MNEKMYQMAKLGVLHELLRKNKELVQTEDLVGGHRGNVDDISSVAQNEVYTELEKVKSEFKK